MVDPPKIRSRRLKHLQQTAEARGENPEQTKLQAAAKRLLELVLQWPESRYSKARAGLRPGEVQAWTQTTLRELAALGPIHTRLGAWATWCVWCEANHVRVRTASVAELRRYIYRPPPHARCVNAARSRWDNLNWFRRNLDAPVPTDDLPRPPAQAKPGGKEQAVAADPEIFFAVDRQVREMLTSDPEYVYGIAHLVMYQVCMRCRHLCRSILKTLGTDLLTGVCLWGKKTAGWTWQIPRYSPEGVDVGGYLWTHYAPRLRPGEKAPVGVFTTSSGHAPLDYPEILEGCRRFLRNRVELPDSEVWTTYSSRRATPTIADILEMSAHQRRAIGHWGNQNSDMPTCYSGARVATSTMARVEAIQMVVGAQVLTTGPMSWEALEGVRHELDPRAAKREASRLVSQDTVIHSLPQEMLGGVAPEAKRFNVSRMARGLIPGRNPAARERGLTVRRPPATPPVVEPVVERGVDATDKAAGIPT